LGLTHEKNFGMLLRRLAGNENTGTLRTLASVVEPVKEYRRYQMRPQTMLSPLTGLVDAVPPESEPARRFASIVDGFISDAPRFALYRQDINDTLVQWRTAGVALGPIIDRAPALQEARPLANNLSDMAQAGLEAMTYLVAGDAAPTEWRDSQLAKLDEAAKPKAALELVVVSSVRKLVIGAAELPQLKSSGPAEWRQRIMRLANPTIK